jgi:hypothetical protein
MACFPVGGPDDELAEQRVVVRGDRVALPVAGVEPGPRPVGHLQDVEPAGCRGEAPGGVLGIDPALDGRTAGDDVGLGQLQAPAGGDQDLLADEVHAGEQLGDRVLDLDPGVHLHEVGRPGAVDQELHRPGAGVAHRQRAVHRQPAELGALLGAEVAGRPLLEELLVPPLQRAVALPEGDAVAVGVAEDLHLHVPGPGEVALEVDGGVAEHRAGGGAGGGERVGQVRRLADDGHAPPAAAGRRLDDQRVADPRGDLPGLVDAADRFDDARQQR